MKISILTILLLSIIFVSHPTIARAETTLNFDPSSITAQKLQDRDINIVLNPDGHEVIGVDLVFEYNPQYLQIIDIKNTGAFVNQTGKIIDNIKGIARYSVSNPYSQFQKATATIAILTFSPKDITSGVYLSMAFSMGKTQDTNVVVARGKDILDRVNSLTIKIEEAQSATTATTSSPPTAAPINQVIKSNTNKNNQTVLGAEKNLDATTDKENKTYPAYPQNQVFGSQTINPASIDNSNFLLLLAIILIAIGCGFIAAGLSIDRKRFVNCSFSR